ncbi:MAG: hypothetical protein ACTH5M_10730 [Psychrobacter sp.]|uniref:hypothetical protein n=1 Tax=Psychrobacter sp. AOP7-B1-24 TaxID=3457645 RepID=UPI003FB9BE04
MSQPITQQRINELLKDIEKNSQKHETSRRIILGRKSLTCESDQTPKVVKCTTYANICQRQAAKDRFLGEDTAMQYLRDNSDNANLAHERIRNHRNTYAGLRETDRNAEHYLYALYKVRENNQQWGTFHVLTYGYSSYKIYLNLIGHTTESLVGNNISPTRGSPATWDELLAGYYGTNDGLYGIRGE